MIFTLVAGILVVALLWSSPKTRSTNYTRIACLLSATAVAESLISLAWEANFGDLTGLWLLAPWTAFPMTVQIEFVAPYLEIGHYEIRLRFGQLLLTSIASPDCGLSLAAPTRMFCAFVVRATASPILLAMNLLPVPFVYLVFRRIKNA